MARADRRREHRAQSKAGSAAWVTVTTPGDFVDCMGEPWQLQRDGQLEDMDLPEVLMVSIRKLPAKSMEDAERALEVLRTLRGNNGGPIELRRADYDWLLAQVREHGHRLWSPPDAALLVEYLRDGMAPAAQGPAADEG